MKRHKYNSSSQATRQETMISSDVSLKFISYLRNSTKPKYSRIPQFRQVLQAIIHMYQGIGNHIIQALHSLHRVLFIFQVLRHRTQNGENANQMDGPNKKKYYFQVL